MARLSKALQPGTVAIDFGTTGVRAVVCANNDTTEKGTISIRHNISIPPPLSGEQINFPSNANLLSEEDLSPLSRLQFFESGILTLPAKMIPYLIRMYYLATASDGKHDVIGRFCAEIPQLGAFYEVFKLLKPLRQANVIHRAYKVFAALLQFVARYAEKQAHTSGIHLERMAFTIPSNWDNWIQKLMLHFIRLLWPMIEEHNIHFIYEAEAVGHYLFRLHKVQASDHPARILIIDWGGHTLNAIIVELQPGSGDRPVFFEIGNVTCEHLGSALFISALKEEAIRKLAKARPKLDERPEIDRAHRENFLKEALHSFFVTKLMDLQPGYGPINLSGELLSGEHVHISINQTTVDRLYNTFIGKGIGKIKTLMARLSNEKAKSRVPFETYVFANGGTLKNKCIRKELSEYASKKDMEYVNAHVDTISIDYRSIVSRGAALAVANSTTLEEYMESAIFAIRLRADQQATDEVPVIWNGGKKIPQKLDLPGQHGSTISLVCQPFAPDRNAKTVPLHKTFQLDAIPMLRQSKFNIEMDYKLTNKEQNKGEITIHWKNKTGSHSAAKTTPEDTGPKPQTLYVDPGQTVAFIDRPDAEGAYNLKDAQYHRKGHRLYRTWQKEQIDGRSVFWKQAMVEGVSRPTRESLGLDDNNPTDLLGEEQALLEKRPSRKSSSSKGTTKKASALTKGRQASKRVADSRLSISAGTSQRRAKKTTTETTRSPTRQHPKTRNDVGQSRPNRHQAQDKNHLIVTIDSDDDEQPTAGRSTERGIPTHVQLADERVTPDGNPGQRRQRDSGHFSISRKSAKPTDLAGMHRFLRKSITGDRELRLRESQLQSLLDEIQVAFHWRSVAERWLEENFENLLA